MVTISPKLQKFIGKNRPEDIDINKEEIEQVIDNNSLLIIAQFGSLSFIQPRRYRPEWDYYGDQVDDGPPRITIPFKITWNCKINQSSITFLPRVMSNIKIDEYLQEVVLKLLAEENLALSELEIPTSEDILIWTTSLRPSRDYHTVVSFVSEKNKFLIPHIINFGLTNEVIF